MKKSLKIILSIAGAALLTGCNLQQRIVEPEKPKIDSTLPDINASTIRTISDIKSIALEWRRPEDRRTTGYYIYRGDTKEGAKLKRVANIENRLASHHLDTQDIEPNTTYVYAIASKGANDTESNPSSLVSTKSLPIMESVTLFNAISGLPRQVKLIWRPHDDKRIAGYQIEKRVAESPEWKRLANIKGRLQVEYIDDKLEDDKIYIYKIKAITFDDIASEPSVDTKAQTKPLPEPISNLVATNNLPKKIIVKWAASPTKDVVGYKIYTSSSNTGSYSLIKEIDATKLQFEDIVTEDGLTKFYKVTAIDNDNLESKQNQTLAMGATLAKPEKPIVTLAQIADDRVILNWKSTDSRTVAFNIYKTIKESWIKSKTDKFAELKIDTTSKVQRIEDKDIVRGVEYQYTIESVDENGLVSEQTQPVSMILPILKDQKESKQQSREVIK